MRALGVLAIAGVGLAIGGTAVWLMKKDEDEDDLLDLPQPSETECTTAEEVWNSTQAVLTGDHNAQGLRHSAKVLKEWDSFCDDNAKAMAQTCIALLEARAATIEQTPPGQTPPPTSQGISIPPSPLQIPGGTYYADYGWCPPGAVLDMATGLCDFTPTVIVPASVLQVPIISTAGGACCASCAHGHACESECAG